MENMRKLREKNRQLKRALATYLNVSLIKKLSKALERINNGEHISEEEFFKNSPQQAF